MKTEAENVKVKQEYGCDNCDRLSEFTSVTCMKKGLYDL